MNIFVTDANPVVSANNLDDKRVNKMILESAQMLSTAVHLLDSSNISVYKSFSPEGNKRKLAIHHEYGKVYMPTHANHPCNVWVRQSRSNYQWLLYHFGALLMVFFNRRGKKHACHAMLDTLTRAQEVVPEGPLQPFANCAAHNGLGLDFKNVKPTTEAYRQYLSIRWSNDKLEPKWSKANRPQWANFTWSKYVKST